LRELVDGLDAGDRLFLKYYYEDELSPEEIATVMSVTVSAIYSKKSRILDKLRSIAKKKRSLQEK
jgi:DNA-directed RNA polymerase specialized sigma24 family protein